MVEKETKKQKATKNHPEPSGRAVHGEVDGLNIGGQLVDGLFFCATRTSCRREERTIPHLFKQKRKSPTLVWSTDDDRTGVPEWIPVEVCSLGRNRSEYFRFEPVSSEISDLCEISYLLLFFSYFVYQNKEIKSGNYFFDVCCVN